MEPFEFSPDGFFYCSEADAIRQSAECNARLNALRRAFPWQDDRNLSNFAYWLCLNAPTPELAVRAYETSWNGLSKYCQQKWKRGIKPHQTARHALDLMYPAATEVAP